MNILKYILIMGVLLNIYFLGYIKFAFWLAFTYIFLTELVLFFLIKIGYEFKKVIK